MRQQTHANFFKLTKLCRFVSMNFYIETQNTLFQQETLQIFCFQLNSKLISHIPLIQMNGMCLIGRLAAKSLSYCYSVSNMKHPYKFAQFANANFRQAFVISFEWHPKGLNKSFRSWIANILNHPPQLAVQYHRAALCLFLLIFKRWF